MSLSFPFHPDCSCDSRAQTADTTSVTRGGMIITSNTTIKNYVFCYFVQTRMAKITADIEAELDAIAKVCGDVCREDAPERTVLLEGEVSAEEAGFAPLDHKRINCHSLYKNLDLLDRPPHPVMNGLYLRLCIIDPFFHAPAIGSFKASVSERPVTEDETFPFIWRYGHAEQLLHTPGFFWQGRQTQGHGMAKSQRH